MSIMVMTGGTSGFGAIAAQRLTDSGDTRLLLGARRPVGIGETIPLDLTKLTAVRDFAAAVGERLDGAAIDALVLNAGIIAPDVTGRTVDGFETTFAVNHLAHYLLLRLLLPQLATGASIVLTTSGTHDPANRAGLAPPRHADAELLAYPDRETDLDAGGKGAGEHAYTASKLCSVLTVRYLTARPEARTRRMRVLAYDPGQVFGTGLAKDLSLPLRVAWSVLGTPVGWPLRRLKRDLNSRAAAGNALADLVLGVATPPAGHHHHVALRRARLTWPPPSELARRDELALALWNDSARLVGLPA